jgi:hypothetical protein
MSTSILASTTERPGAPVVYDIANQKGGRRQDNLGREHRGGLCRAK